MAVRRVAAMSHSKAGHAKVGVGEGREREKPMIEVWKQVGTEIWKGLRETSDMMGPRCAFMLETFLTKVSCL